MKTALALVTALCLSLVAANANAQNRGEQEPHCMQLTKRNIQGFAIFAHQLAVTVAQDGGSEAVESKLNAEENKAVQVAFTELYAAGSGGKCLALTKLQALSLFKAVVVMMAYVDVKHLREDVEKGLVDLVGAEKMQQLGEDILVTTKAIGERAGLKITESKKQGPPDGGTSTVDL
jgi:hypothetical protein